MNPRILAVLVLLVPATVWADDFVGLPGGTAVGPVVPTYGPVYMPYGTFWGHRHWIYGYMPAYDHSLDRYGVVDPYSAARRYDGRYDSRYDDRYGVKPGQAFKHYEGRATLEPAIPYSEYLQHLRRVQAAQPARPAQAAIPTVPTLPTPNIVTEPSADKAVLEFSLPTETARLWLDNQPIEGDGKVRMFQTPALKAGQDYRFAVKVTWPSTNPFEDHSNEQIVTFRAGERKLVEIRAKK